MRRSNRYKILYAADKASLTTKLNHKNALTYDSERCLKSYLIKPKARLNCSLDMNYLDKIRGHRNTFNTAGRKS